MLTIHTHTPQNTILNNIERLRHRYIPNCLQLLRSLETLIDQTYRDNLDLEAYSQQLHISPRRLNRLTEKLLSKTVYELIQDRLHKEALTLLQYSAFTAKEIADDLGICDAAYFSRCFKKRTGLSPREYRKAVRTK